MSSVQTVRGNIAYARPTRSHLIVLGRHGQRAFRDLVIGSTAERVIRKGTTPVLAVSSPAGGPYRRHLVHHRITSSLPQIRSAYQSWPECRACPGGCASGFDRSAIFSKLSALSVGMQTANRGLSQRVIRRTLPQSAPLHRHRRPQRRWKDHLRPRVPAQRCWRSSLVPRADVIRRFARGWHNFQTAYRPVADAWAVYDNSRKTPRLPERGP